MSYYYYYYLQQDSDPINEKIKNFLKGISTYNELGSHHSCLYNNNNNKET